MASNQNNVLLQCTWCHAELKFESKTLPCLHSFCSLCLGGQFMGETDGIGQCPECHEYLTLNELSLSPLLVESLKHRQLESTSWKCDFCLKDGIESPATSWCLDCQKLFCANCSTFHKKFHPGHNARDLDVMERSNMIKAMMKDSCSFHKKANHSPDSPGCLSPPLSLREEALIQKSQSPTLAKDLDDLEMSLRRVNERTKSYTDELNSNCDLKGKQLWEDFMEMVENANQKTNELCEDMRRMTAEQVKRWHLLLEENDKILRQLGICRLNLRHLNKFEQDYVVVCGLQLLGSKPSSWLDKSVVLGGKCQLEVTFPNWWLQALEKFKSEQIGSVSLTLEKLPAINLVCDKHWDLRRSNSGVSSIHVSEDDHVFLCNCKYSFIMEFTEGGDFVGECKLFDGINKFNPYDMCSTSSGIFVVAWGYNNKLILLERSKIPPFLKIKKIISTAMACFFLCQLNEIIIVCDSDFQIYSLTKDGENMNIIRPRESTICYWPRIRADPSTRSFWGERMTSSEMCFNLNGERIRSVKTDEITNFCVSEFGHLYFCNLEGIYSLPPKKDLYKFEKES